MKLLVKPDGTVRAIYAEEIDLAVLGRPRSPAPATSSPTLDGRWHADLTPVGGPVLGPFDRRSEALDAERAWLERHWLLDATDLLVSSILSIRPLPFAFHPDPDHPPARPRRVPLPVRAGPGRCAAGSRGHRPGREGVPP